MPIAYRILAGHKLVHTWTQGGVTDREMSEHRAQLRADPAFRPEFDQLIECQGVSPSSITNQGVYNAVELSVFSPRSRRAIVAIKDASFGVARMFALMQPEGVQVEVFRQMEPALRWLGLPETALGTGRDPQHAEQTTD